jgi:hypothetical protein
MRHQTSGGVRALVLLIAFGCSGGTRTLSRDGASGGEDGGAADARSSTGTGGAGGAGGSSPIVADGGAGRGGSGGGSGPSTDPCSAAGGRCLTSCTERCSVGFVESYGLLCPFSEATALCTGSRCCLPQRDAGAERDAPASCTISADCGADRLCVAFVMTVGPTSTTTRECRANPCAGGPLTCTCAGSLCTAPSSMCAVRAAELICDDGRQ